MNDLPQRRCPKCNRLLFYGYVRRVAIKCPKCGRIYELGDDANLQQRSDVNDRREFQDKAGRLG